MATGDLDEYKIRQPAHRRRQQAACPQAEGIDGRAVCRFTPKCSAGKISVPGAEQIFRGETRDAIARAESADRAKRRSGR
jgi:hypothetical protein